MANTSDIEKNSEAQNKSPKPSSFGRIERIRSSSFDGYHSKHFIDATYKYPDWNASSFGINRVGKLAILAAKRGFMVVDFDNPEKERKYSCNFKWEPGTLEWNPHHAQDYLYASVMNQKVEIWNVNILSSGASPDITLSGHTRAISDINWNYFEPHSLLTCSMDTYINLWDIRTNKRPSSTFTTVAGSSQVKWNRKNNFLFGSAHDGDIRIWDIRKGNIPTVYIAGHLSKINGFDWSPHKEEYFVTASNDATVKIWNMTSPKQPWVSINNSSAVWKARYTPFGNGLVTILVPQLRRIDNSLLLWNITQFKTPVHKFTGHQDVVLEFQWRSQKKDDQEDYQLVSWSKDQTLRLWRANKKTIQSITGEPYIALTEEAMDSSLLTIDDSHFEEKKKTQESPGSPPMMSSTYKDPSTLVKKSQVKPPERPEQLTLFNLNLIDTKPSQIQSPLSPHAFSPRGKRGAFYSTGKQTSLSPTDLSSGYMTTSEILHREFTLLNLDSPVFRIEKKDSEARLCIIAVRAVHIYFKLHIKFPRNYPDRAQPEFLFSEGSKIDDESKKKIVDTLMEVSNQHVKFNRPCLEACLRKLRYLIGELEEYDSRAIGENPAIIAMNSSYPFKRGEPGSDTSYMDSTVPFPRTCGARFCSVGDILVVFSRPEKYNNIVIAERSLRSMSALNDYLQDLSADAEFDAGENQNGTLKKPKPIGRVYISNTISLLPVSKQLAENYVLHGDDPSALCLRNAQLAAQVMRKDLVQTWTLLSKVLAKELEPTTSMSEEPWACHSFGRKMIKSLFHFYERLKDVQTLAMMSCILMKQRLPYDMIHELTKMEKMEEGEKQLSRPSTRFSSNPESLQLSPEYSPYDVYNTKSSVGKDSSWSPPDFTSEEKVIDPEEELRKAHRQSSQFLDQNENFRYDQFKRNYAEILYRWEMHPQRTEIVKYCSEKQNNFRAWDLSLECTTCGGQQRYPCCETCKSFIVKCTVCRISVRGLLSFCRSCGHGGHMFHLIDWFKQYELCATGCGCPCLKSGQFMVG